ncbi:hypothetical protein AJ80_06998 [Polytolypa hystricis UAMH7299]|uniref:Major facilitator superfamily (MFS) profile domain-containing protein n=1 Tax=Polytolypa hystricis (strain UAMH7299) TaxID=1447883 RepID=A0A2B7XTC1_POLH7|nr:hypothetical protein AJ80_06998 [Polytolypa hystricis UAMH7299]
MASEINASLPVRALEVSPGAEDTKMKIQSLLSDPGVAASSFTRCSSTSATSNSSDGGGGSYCTSALEDQVTAVVLRYSAIKELNPVITQFVRSHGPFHLLYEVFEHYLTLVQSRSQAFEDGHITVYDKALLVLTSNGSDLYNKGAITLYFDEIVGITLGSGVGDLENIAQKHLVLKELLMKAQGANGGTQCKSLFQSQPQVSSDAAPTSKDNGAVDATTTPAAKTASVQEYLIRILGTFATAKEEYNKTIEDTDVVAKSRSAKFLRDTAENILNYLRARGLDHYMIPELETAFQQARDKAIVLSGGRKRPFERQHDECYHHDHHHHRHHSPRSDSYRPHHKALFYSRSPLERLVTNMTDPAPAPFSRHGGPSSFSSSSPTQDTPSTSSQSAADEPHDSTPRAERSSLARLQTDFSDDEDQRLNDTFGELDDYTPRKEGDGDEDDEDLEMIERSKTFTPEEERRVVKKFDRRLTLFMALLYMLSFLDRSNIGNAKIAGLTEDLNLTSSQYEWALTAFYITYIIFEWMTLLYNVVPAHIYISICVFSWGLFASFQSLVSSFWVLVFLRAMLGIAEAAFGPGLPFYLSFFYKREELAFRTGLFISAAPLATSFASSLAWLITWLSKDGPIAPWRALFLFEGFPSVIVAVFAWHWVPDGPGKARYLTPRERRVAKLRLKQSQGTTAASQRRDKMRGQRGFDWREIGRTMRDPKAYLTAFMFFSCNVAFSSMPVYLPTILKDMGYSALTSQALSAPPYILSFITVVLTSSLSDRLRQRSIFIISLALLSSLAYFTIGLTGIFHTHFPSPTLHILIRYISIFPATAGFFSAITIIITWTLDNQRAKEGKGTGMAILNLIGQCGPLVGTRLYPERDGPWYVRGMMVCAGFMLVVAVLAVALRMLLIRENRRMSSGEERERGEEIEMVEGEAAGLMGVGAGAGTASGERIRSERFVYIV